MASRVTHVADIGDVTIIRKKGVRSLRLRVEPNGGVRLTMPWWVHTRVGLQFLNSKAEWVKEQQQVSGLTIRDGMKFGERLQIKLVSVANSKITSRWDPPYLKVNIPEGEKLDSKEVQQWLEKAAFKRLRIQAEEQLLPRLQFLADLHDFDFKSSEIRKLKARWGSCSSKREITLNAYLVQLPSELVDYVLIHELVHTQHLHHGKDFWLAVEVACPDFKNARKVMKQYQPRLYPTLD